MKNDIIKSPIAAKMLSHILPIYDNDEYILSAFQVIGKEMDELWKIVNEISEQVYPQRATWTLDFWEQQLGIKHDVALTLEERRKRILVKLNTYHPVNRERIRFVASSAAGVDVQVIELTKKYIFHVVLLAKDMNVVNRQVWESVDDVKPAHLSSIYYVKIGDTLYLIDKKKTSVAPVLKFFMNIGKGYIKEILPTVKTKTRIGIGKPAFSSELRSGPFQMLASLSHGIPTYLKAVIDERVGNGEIDVIAVSQEHKARSNNSSVNMSVLNKNGMYKPEVCGAIWAERR